MVGSSGVDPGDAGNTPVVTSDERCGEVLDGVQCQLRAGHVPEAHVAGRRGGAGRRSWLLGRDYETDVDDSELDWAAGFPQP